MTAPTLKDLKTRMRLEFTGHQVDRNSTEYVQGYNQGQCSASVPIGAVLNMSPDMAWGFVEGYESIRGRQ